MGDLLVFCLIEAVAIGAAVVLGFILGTGYGIEYAKRRGMR